MDESPLYSTTESRTDWRQARRTAFAQEIAAAFTQRPTDLLPFEEVRQRLQLRNARYLGLQDVPIDQIVGSVDRYEDFTRAFFPRHESMGSRWQRVNQLVSSSTGLSPVELYKVGEVYFVRDGNHRVSVARQHNAPSVQAYVYEYTARVPISSDTDINDLLIKAAHAEFVQRTNIDRLCPDVRIELTSPDGYEELLFEIEGFRQIISNIDEREVSFDEAVSLWCEMRYSPIVDIIEDRDMMRDFPNRTEADLYLWLRRSQEELDVRYGKQHQLEETADRLTRMFGEKLPFLRAIREGITRLAGGVGELGGRLVESIKPDTSKEALAISRAQMDFVCVGARPAPPLRFRGTTQTEWATWQVDFRERLWETLGVGPRPLPPYTLDDLAPEIQESEMIGDVRRELVWIRVEPKLYVPLYVFVPQDTTGPRPAIVVFPGHGTINQTAGIEKSYQRGNALELARAGYITMTMELRGFGLLGTIGHLRIDAAARLLGRTWYGLLVHDALRAIDYLTTRPEVFPTRIGATGIGAGGALTMYVAALDERIQVALVNGYLSKYIVDCLHTDHCPCNDIPGLRSYADMGDVASLIAPRPVLFVNGARDPLGNPSARESFSIVNQVYRIIGAYNRARLIEPETLKHYYDNQLAIGWFRQWLRPDVVRPRSVRPVSP
ncbi:MAG: hypothetical protein GX620_11710 [Chloroflexi bacterium]|nr:hypothetical protein [Chloroflexota bacterium]